MPGCLRFARVGAAASLSAAAFPSVPDLVAQETDVETRVITVTTFHVPVGEKLRAALDYLDKYSVPAARENPHVLRFRYATHAWGSTAANVWIIHEHESLAAVEEAQAWGSAWFEERFPAGTWERSEADRAFEEDYAPYLSKHEDHILTVRADRAN